MIMMLMPADICHDILNTLPVMAEFAASRKWVHVQLLTPTAGKVHILRKNTNDVSCIIVIFAELSCSFIHITCPFYFLAFSQHPS